MYEQDHDTPMNTDLEAENSLLGAIINNSKVLDDVADQLISEFFYFAKNRAIFQAILELSQKGEDVDEITIVEQLKNSFTIEKSKVVQEIDRQFLIELRIRNLLIASPLTLAKRIKDTYILRSITTLADELKNDSFSTLPVENILEKAQSRVYSLAETKVDKNIYSIREVIEDSGLEHGSYGKEGNKNLISSGFKDLDKTLGGLHGSDLIVLAARPGMGKTSLALKILEKVSGKGHGVLMFSLEMGKEQLVKKIISSLSMLPLRDLHMNSIGSNPSFMTQYSAGVGQAIAMPIWIDDAAGLNIVELKSKARKLKARHNIKLIIVDYLQLLSSTQASQGGNRTNEIGEISRGLKILAKDLNIPVIALSQLSRAVEARDDKRPMLSDLRESGCLLGDTLILNSKSGDLVTIEEMAKGKNLENFYTIAINDKLKLNQQKVTKAFSSGIKKVYELKTQSGKIIKASANHPFYKLNGWTPLDQLNVGDSIATPRKINISNPTNPLTDNELILLAHLIGDGCILPKQPYHYTSADKLNLDIVSKVSSELFGINSKLVDMKTYSHIYLPSPIRLTHNISHPITDWLNKLGLERVRSYDKKLPSSLFNCNESKISLFLNHLWATDGNISMKNGSVSVYYATSSRLLAEQVSHLLLRLGILSSIGTIKQGKYRPMYNVRVNNYAPNLLLFLNNVGCYGSRGFIIPDIVNQIQSQSKPNPNLDVIPKEVWSLVINPIRIKMNYTWREFAKKLGWSYSGTSLFKTGIGNKRANEILKLLNDESLENIVNSDIYWDKIKSIEHLGEHEVYDATVPNNHNFIANNIIVHNSIEQDADIVMFIHRDAMYRKDGDKVQEGEDKNIGKSQKADIIIAKHRNGPTGRVEIEWIPERATFEDFGTTNGMNKI
jgi:replicative DNA helicase